MHPIFDIFCLILACVLTNLITRVPILTDYWISAQFIGVMYLTLIIGGVYKIVWGRSSIRDYGYLAEVMFIGSLLTLIVSNFTDSRWTLAHLVFFILLSALFILGERLSLQYLESWTIKKLYIKNALRNGNVDKIVIFGAGQGCRTYLNSMGYMGENIFNIIGIIDDDKALSGMKVYGHKVLGTRTNLEQIYAKTPFQRLIISTQDISGDVLEGLKEFANKHEMKVYNTSFKTVEV